MSEYDQKLLQHNTKKQIAFTENLLFSSHLFAIASTSYGRMMKNTENQVIVIR